MSLETQKGRGRLVPALPTGIAYQVDYGIQFTPEIRRHGRSSQQAASTRWTKCSVRSAHVQAIPSGKYFLYTEEGKIYQVKSVDGKWHYLATS